MQSNIEKIDLVSSIEFKFVWELHANFVFILHCRHLVGTFCWPFFTLGNAHAHIYFGLRRRGGNISVDFSLFVLLCNSTSWISLNLMSFLKRKTKKFIYCTNFLQSTKLPHFALIGKVIGIFYFSNQGTW